MDKTELRIMSHTGDLGDSGLIQGVEPGIAVGMQVPAETGQLPLRMFALTVGGIAVQHRRRPLSGVRALIAQVDPQPPRLGRAAPGIEHR